MWQSSNTIRIGQDAAYSAPLPGRQYIEQPGTPTEEVCQDSPYMILLPGGQYARGQGFILVYRLAMDARPWRGDGVADRKYPSLLEDFQTGTASMARKRHLASTARGF